MSSSSSSTNNDDSVIKIDWNELISSFESHYSKCRNQNNTIRQRKDDDDDDDDDDEKEEDDDDDDDDDDDEDDDHFVIPTVQVDTNCCVVIVPMDIDNDDDDHDHDNIDRMIQKQHQKKNNKIHMEEPPNHYTYHITIIGLIIEKCTGTIRNDNNETSGYTIHLYSTSDSTVEFTFNHLLHWFNHSNSLYSNHDYYWNITIQTFAKQPRTILPTTIHDQIFSNEINDKNNTNSGNIRTLRICYFTINHTLLEWSNNQQPSTNSIEKIELIQCTINCNWNDLFVATQRNQNTTIGLVDTIQSPLPLIAQQKQRHALSISCSLPEFIKCIPFLHSCTTNITDLSLILHFYIPDNHNWYDFCMALCHCCTHTLINLSIQYLDLSDIGWDTLCTTLQNNVNQNSSSSTTTKTCTIRSISLSYTDNFIDNHRRLSDVRRTKRTQSILSLVQSIPSIQNIHFPIYQQDPILMNEIQTILEQRRLETTTIIL
jgi:hypothetical protein